MRNTMRNTMRNKGQNNVIHTVPAGAAKWWIVDVCHLAVSRFDMSLATVRQQEAPQASQDRPNLDRHRNGYRKRFQPTS